MTELLNNPVVKGVAAILILVVIGVLHAIIQRKINSIDRAVNHRGPDDPKLYDISNDGKKQAEANGALAEEAVKVALDTRNATMAALADIGRKIDHGVGDISRRIDGVDARLKGIDDRVDGIDERSGINSTRLEREVTRIDRRIDTELKRTLPT